MKEFNLNLDKKFIRKRFGNITQLGGLKKYRLSEGRADGVDAVDVKTGSGLNYTILPGRGMDIAWTDYKGVPISYMSSTGVCNANLYDSKEMEWLNNFFAGLLTTCGFSNVGGPCKNVHPVIGERTLGLHGKLTNLPASEVSTFEGWKEGEYVMKVSGKMRESCLHGENITLRRTITSYLGKNKIILPIDQIVSFDMESDECMPTINENIPLTFYGFDIGPKTRTYYDSELANAKIVFWNGPMGVFEKEMYAEGTKKVCESIANLKKAFSVIGGGDSASAAKQLGFKDKFSHVSTGGGASLEMIENDGVLPGIEIIQDK